jgi:diguanylate cyclase (GGDEF)-like protein
MKWLKGIAFRFWLAINILILVAVFATSIVHLLSEKEHLEDSLQEEGTTLANTIGSAIGLSMLQGDYSQISPLAYSLINQPEVKYVTIRDNSGNVVNQKGETTDGNDNVMIERVPILYFQKNVGEIEIALKTEKMEEQVQSLVKSTILTALLTSLASVLLSYWISKRLTSPLNKLVDATKEMTKGNRNVAVTEENITEINELVIAFNLMSKTIEDFEGNLVNKINQATKSLSDKIKILEAVSNIARSAIEQNPSQREVILVSLKEIAQYLKVDRLSVAVWKEEAHENFLILTLNEEQELEEETVCYLETPIYQVLQNKRPVYRTHSDSVGLFERERFLSMEGIASTAIIPLIAKDKVLGTLNLGSKQEDLFAGINEEEVLMFANQLAIALDRASLYESLRTAAYHDFLTGLPNSRYLRERMEGLLKQSKIQVNRKFAVLFLDLDRFKNINDTLGHEAGDLVLKGVSQRLLSNLNYDYTISRMGGDEFIILVPNISKAEEAVNEAKNVLTLFHKPIRVKNYELHITGSIGIAFYPNDGEDVETLITHADTAMYRVKESGKNNYAIYSPLKSDPIFDKLFLENELRRALKDDEFVVYYQPKINIFTGTISGIEALVRWDHPKHGILTPGTFIPIAEETGLIVPLGEFVIRNSAKQMVAWQKEGFPPIPIAVNLSTIQFLQSNLVETVDMILKETGLSPYLLELEITESMTMDIERSIEILTSLKKLGIKISIDDFGTGYSSLHYLQQLPIDRLKIDQSFIENITSNEGNAAIVSTIIHMAKKLELTVTAEGVETINQAEYLQKQHCEEVQGYYFSKPLSAKEFEANYSQILNNANYWKIESH